MAALKLTGLLLALASLCLCDDAQHETRTILNQVPVYNHGSNLVPDQGQDYKSNIGYGYTDNYENVYKQYYAGNYGGEYGNAYGNEYNTAANTNDYGSEYNNAANTKAVYDHYGNGYASDYAGQYGQLYEKNGGNEFTNNGLISGSHSAYAYGDIASNTKQVVAEIPSGNYYGYSYGEGIKTNGGQGESVNNEVNGKSVQSPTGTFNGYNYGESENVKTIPPIQVPGQDYHEYSYEEALKASGALDASGNIIANTKSSPAHISSGNQYGYNYGETHKTDGVSDQRGTIAQIQPASYYGYNYGNNVQTASKGYKDLQQNLYAGQLSAGLPTNPKSEITNSIGHLYNNVANVAFNKRPESQAPQQYYYADRSQKQLNFNDQIGNAYLSGYGYGNANHELVSKAVPSDAYQVGAANKYDELTKLAFNSAANDYKNNLATALVYHTNSEGSFGQKSAATGANNDVVIGYEKLNSYPLPASTPAQISKPHNYEYKSVQAISPNLHDFTQSVLKSFAQNYPASISQSTAVQIPQTYSTGSKPYPVRTQYSASEAQTISGLDSHAYIDSALQSLSVAKPQTNIHSSYVKEQRAVQGSEGVAPQEPKIVAAGTYQYAVQPQYVHGQSSTENNHGTNLGPATFSNNGYESNEYNHAELDTEAYKTDNAQTGSGKQATTALNLGVNEVKSGDFGYTGFNSGKYGSIGSVSNAYQPQHGAYNTINYDSHENTAKQYDFNKQNATGDVSNLYGYNGYESYTNEQALKAAEQFAPGFAATSYQTNAFDQQPSGYSSDNYATGDYAADDTKGYQTGDYAVDDTKGYQTGDHTSNNIQTSAYEPSTYKTITNASFDLGYESGYESDSYGSNGFKPIELTTSGYETGNQETSGYKFSAQDPQDFAAYSQGTHDQKTSVQAGGDFTTVQFKPHSYTATQAEAAKILPAENKSAPSGTTHSVGKDHGNHEEKSKFTGKVNKPKKGKSGSSSTYVSVTHGNSSYSYNVHQQNDK